MIPSETTETVLARFANLDQWPLEQTIHALAERQLSSLSTVLSMITELSEAARGAAMRLEDNTGRLIYVGAGASGRLAVQDGVELAPTFDWPNDRLIYLVAGGTRALTESIEGAEDDAQLVENILSQHAITSSDVLICVAASGQTPFAIQAARHGKQKGALVISIVNNANTPLAAEADYPIALLTGAEVIAGSTRMAAGTAQKVALNILSSGIMIQLNRVYKNLMVDLASSNQKLDKRRINILKEIIDTDNDGAKDLLEQSNNSIKIASLIGLGASHADAKTLLQQHKNNLRAAIAALQNQDSIPTNHEKERTQ